MKDFPNLPADVAGPIEAYDRALADGTLVLTDHDQPVIGGYNPFGGTDERSSG